MKKKSCFVCGSATTDQGFCPACDGKAKRKELYAGFVCDRARELGVPLKQIVYASRRVNNKFVTTLKKHPKSGLPRWYVETADVATLDAVILGNLSASKVSVVVPKPARVPKTPSLADELRAVVTTLNRVVEELEKERGTNSLLRQEVARLSAASRRAMVVYGD